MRFNIDIEYSQEKMDDNRKRMEARANFKYYDRVPVAFCIEPRYFAPIFGIEYGTLFDDVTEHYLHQLKFLKYRIENIPEDIWTTPAVTVIPYFDNVLNSSSLGAEIIWSKTETPHACPVIHTVDQMNDYVIPEPDAGLWGKKIQWHLKMQELIKETNITFSGKEGKVELYPLCTGGEGPHMMAIDLVGENFYWWMLEYPEECHRFMKKITTAIIQAEKNFRKIDPRSRSSFILADDSAQVMSADMFKEFCVPYDDMIWSLFDKGIKDGRGMHMCGKSDHLLEALAKDAKITSFNVFGFPADLNKVAEHLGGKAWLWGNINPMLMLDGTAAEVKAASLNCLSKLAHYGGLMLGDGANICPGTSIENLAALTEASKEFGLPGNCGRR